MSKELNSGVVTKGTERAPHRSLLYAMGRDKTNLEKPLIGVANSFSELIPGHMHLQQIAEKVKEGAWSAGGVPAEFGTIGVCDGLVLVTNCDKIIPGMVMAAAGGPIGLIREGDRIRIDIPAKRLDLLLPEAELVKRKAAFSPVSKQTGSPFLDSYSQNVTSAASGAIRKPKKIGGNDEDKRS